MALAAFDDSCDLTIPDKSRRFPASDTVTCSGCYLSNMTGNGPYVCLLACTDRTRTPAFAESRTGWLLTPACLE